MLDDEPLRETVRLRLDEPHTVSCATHRDEGMSAAACQCGDVGSARSVHIDHCRLAWLQQHLEQTHLGGEIVFNRGMIIEVVASEIREGGSGKPDAVEPAL